MNRLALSPPRGMCALGRSRGRSSRQPLSSQGLWWILALGPEFMRVFLEYSGTKQRGRSAGDLQEYAFSGLSGSPSSLVWGRFIAGHRPSVFEGEPTELAILRNRAPGDLLGWDKSCSALCSFLYRWTRWKITVSS